MFNATLACFTESEHWADGYGVNMFTLMSQAKAFADQISAQKAAAHVVRAA